MKLISLLLMLVIILPISYASMEIVNQPENEYNFGDEIDFSVKIIPDVSTTALVKLTLKCTNKEIPYYITPIELEEGKSVVIEAFPIKAFSEGLCNIRANVESLEGGELDGITSDEFTVSDKLELSFTLDATDVMPGDEIKIEGSASKKGNGIKEGIVTVRFDNNEVQVKLKSGKFSHELKLDEDIKSGEHTITVEVNDDNENFNSESAVIDVEAVPTEIKIEINGNEFKPEETLLLVVNLLDQAGDVIPEKVDVKLIKWRSLFKDEIVLFSDSIEGEFEFTFNYSTLPLDYSIMAVFDELESEEVITILAYPKIDMKLNGDTVFIKNIGNVKYNDETTIVLDRENKTYIINKNVKLDVGEETTIDLSKEVGSGSYTVTLPEDSVVEEKVVDKKVPIEKEVNVIKNVEIENDGSLGWITGNVITGAGLLLSKSGVGSTLMILILLAIVAYFNRKRILKLIEKIKEKRENRY